MHLSVICTPPLIHLFKLLDLDSRISIIDAPTDFGQKIKNIDCVNLQPEVMIDDEVDMMDKEMEEEIMREILEQEQEEKKRLGLEDEDKPKKKKKRSKGKKKSKK